MKSLIIVLFIFCVISTVAYADSVPQLFTDPFHNKIFLWNGKTIVNALDASDVQTISTDGILTDAPPLVWAENQILFPTQEQILLFDRSTHTLQSLYSIKGTCPAGACIRSLMWVGIKEVHFTENQNGVKRGMELSSSGVKPLAENPVESSDALIAMEGETGSGDLVTVFFDGTKVTVKNKSGTKTVDATAATFDACSGRIWYLDSRGMLVNYSTNAYAPDLPVSARQCPLITHWNLIDRQGSTMNQDRWDVIQGYPAGTPRVPATQVVSLGVKGAITLESSRVIHATGGVDFRVFENVMQHTQGLFKEPGSVEVFDGEKWVSTGCDCEHPAAEFCAGMQVTNSTPGNGMVPWDSQAGGFAVNLSLLGIQSAKRVRITDCGKSDPSPMPAGIFAGFDLDAIVVTPAALGEASGN